MAASKLRDLSNDYLTCGICMDPFNTPKVLPCIHTFCQKCIEQYMKTTGDPFPCPMCKRQTKVPPGGVINFQTNHLIVGMMDVVKSPIKDSHCTLCKEMGVNLPATSRCIECSDYLCEDCTAAHPRNRVTRNHKLIQLGELNDKDIQEELSLHQKTYCSVHKDEVIKYFCIQDQTAICHACTLMEHHGHKCESLSKAAEKMKHFLQEHLSTLNPIIIRQETNLEILQYQEKNIKENGVDTLDKVEKWGAEIQKKVNAEKDRIKSEIITTTAAESKQILAAKDEAERSLATLKSTKDIGNRLIEYGNDAEVLLVHQQVMESTKQLTAQKQFVKSTLHLGVDYESTVNIRLTKNQTMDSLMVMPEYLMSFDAKTKMDKNHCFFTGIACLPSGDMFIIDSSNFLHGNNNLKMFDSKGVLKWNLPMGDQVPYNVAVTADNNLMVTKGDSSKVDIIDFSGKKVKSVASCVSRCESPSLAMKGDTVILTGSNKACVYICNKNLQARKIICSQQFKSPHYAALNHNYIIVSDYAHCVFIYSRSGDLLATYGTPGTPGDGPGKLNRPYGVCIDKYDKILIADHQNKKVHLISPRGEFVKFVLTKDELENCPLALAITPEGHLVVTMTNSLVKMFKYMAIF